MRARVARRFLLLSKNTKGSDVDISKLMYRDGLMSGQRILITGGGSGLGKEMSEGFLKMGAEVHICGRRRQICEDTANELVRQHGGTVVPHVCDIRDPDVIDQMVERIWGDYGPLSGLVNNAAGNFISRTEDLSIRGFDAISNIVFRGTFYMTHNVGKRWINDGEPGNVLSILATWVWNGGPFVVPSAMSKAAVNAMSQSLAVEWGRYGVRHNAIAPGPFPTEGMSNRLAPDKEGQKLMSTGRGNPMGRAGEMHELVNLAIFLMAPGAEYVNGQTIAIDGALFNATGGNFSDLSAWTDDQWAQARQSIERQNQKDKADQTTE